MTSRTYSFVVFDISRWNPFGADRRIPRSRSGGAVRWPCFSVETFPDTRSFVIWSMQSRIRRKPVRVDAVRAIAQMEGDDGALLLRLKARVGDPNFRVTG